MVSAEAQRKLDALDREYDAKHRRLLWMMVYPARVVVVFAFVSLLVWWLAPAIGWWWHHG